MTQATVSRRGTTKGTVLITKERVALAENAERTSNFPFTARDARGIVGLTTMQSARDMIDRLVKLKWAEQTVRPKYARSKDPTDAWYQLTAAGVTAILGQARSDAMFQPKTPKLFVKSDGTLVTRKSAPEERLSIILPTATGLVTVSIDEARTIYKALSAIFGKGSDA